MAKGEAGKKRGDIVQEMKRPSETEGLSEETSQDTGDSRVEPDDESSDVD